MDFAHLLFYRWLGQGDKLLHLRLHVSCAGTIGKMKATHRQIQEAYLGPSGRLCLGALPRGPLHYHDSIVVATHPCDYPYLYLVVAG